jgi:D-2-hydroxyacid dehydrogenase (NADP+)
MSSQWATTVAHSPASAYRSMKGKKNWRLSPRSCSIEIRICRNVRNESACCAKMCAPFRVAAGRIAVLPDKDEVTICFAHTAYRFQECFKARQQSIASFEVQTQAELDRRIGEAEILVVSGLWHNELLARAPKLALIQSISAGVDQFPLEALRAKKIRLTSAQGANERAVAEHAMALLLALYRRLPEARDNQKQRNWRGMVPDINRREDELGGKTLLIVGLGRIGGRLAKLAKAFDLRVFGIRRDPKGGRNNADEVYGIEQLEELLPEADVIVLTCPLTPQTDKIISSRALSLMNPSALLINVSRGACVDETALIDGLRTGAIRGAGLDCFQNEPLPPSSPLWDFGNVLITPHTAGETHRYEENVLDILMGNLNRLWRGESALQNQIV